MKLIYCALIGLMLLPAARADEGMWQPGQLPALAEVLQERGLQIPAASLNDLSDYPMAAIVSLGNCSASFVSPEGLVITNHHCIQKILQHNSTPERNLIENGYLAENRADELSGGPGNRILVTVEVRDVSKRMLDGLASEKDGLKRFSTLQRREKELIASCESENGFRCAVHAFYEGLEYYLIRQLEIRDVRLVYAPSRNIGEFGGDIDNWMWPRHTGDYAFIRGYVAVDGSPTDFDLKNVAYSPEHYLTVSTDGLSKDDFAMAIGYPGRTYRHRLAAEADTIGSWYYPTRKKLYEKMLTTIERETIERGDAAIAYSSLVQSLNNIIKNYGGMIEGFSQSGLVARKRQSEQQLAGQLSEDNAGSLSRLNELITEYQQGREHRMVYRDFLRRRAALLSAASQLYRLSIEKEKADEDREPGFQQRDWLRIREKMQALNKRFDAQVDRALFAQHLRDYAALPAGQRVAALDDWFAINDAGINAKDLAAKLDQMYRDTTLDEYGSRLLLLDASTEDFANSKDPFIQLAIRLYDDDLAFEEKSKRFNGRFQLARSEYMQQLISWMSQQGRPLYADANGTLRVSFGQVRGYQPRDGVMYEPFTTLRGLKEKHTASVPFDVPAALLAAIDQESYGVFADKELGTIPVNFLATLDSTGGNSGSAVLDANARLAGLLFDGNYEAINSDWYLDPAITRSICVDMRYVLWIMESVDGAGHLLREMGIGPTVLHALRPQAGVN